MNIMATPTPHPSPEKERGRRARLGHWLRRQKAAWAPSPLAWRGAAAGILLAALATWLWFALHFVTADSVAGPLLFASAGLVAALIAASLLLLLLALIQRLPSLFRRAVAASSVLLIIALLTGPSLRAGLLALVVILAGAALTGGALAAWRQEAARRRAALARLGALVLGLVLLLGGAAWLFWPGPAAPVVVDAAAAGALPAPLPLPDPAAPGPYDVATLTYGSGKDRHRPEYGVAVDVMTTAVDGRHILNGWDGLSGRLRSAYWGFDAGALPRNGRVWYPQGAGPFPLVLVVHGNHLAEDFSDAGYAYLGALLASRGYIFVSVDENFLNSSLADFPAGLEQENDARGWLLLEHLALWHHWQQDKDSPFYGKVDTARIALIGHSRGGEAVAVAAAFNELDHFPDDATHRFDYHFDIGALIAIAPVDGQYRPAGIPTPLRDLSYLVLQGSHDADLYSFDGLNQFHRVSFTAGTSHFKAAVYVYRANHGQFNTTWGAYDQGNGLTQRFLNTAALLPAADQRRVAAVYVSAFLDSTLRGEAGYRPLFYDHRYGRAWLPDTVYLTQYGDAHTAYVATFEEDLAPDTGTMAGSTVNATGVRTWRENNVGLRFGPGDNRALSLGWDDEEGVAALTVTLPPQALDARVTSALVFDLADAGGDGTAQDGTVLLADSSGKQASLPLHSFSLVQPQLEGVYLKARFLHEEAVAEPIFQTFVLPLASFAAQNPAFDPASLASIQFVFPREGQRTLLVDAIGLRAGGE
jgi:hypothetical protein